MVAGRKTSTIYIKEKWGKELKEQTVSEEEWFKIYKCSLQPPAPYMERIQLENMVRFFMTLKISCRLCGQVDVGHTQIFWFCQKITGYYDSMSYFIWSVLHMT